MTTIKVLRKLRDDLRQDGCIAATNAKEQPNETDWGLYSGLSKGYDNAANRIDAEIKRIKEEREKRCLD